MNENELKIAKIKVLLDAYMRVFEAWSTSSPGNSAYAIWNASDWIRKQLREALK
jgi:hypothetical protein